MATRLRADARRNRAALLTAAREVFAEQGLDASLDEIARRAGVGNATLYRRFPSRRHLIAEVFASHLTAAVRLADQACEHPDAWAAFIGYLTRVCELQATDRGLAELLVTTDFDDDERLAALRATVQQRAADVITRAQRAGRLRSDFTRHDLWLVMMANAGVTQHAADPHAWRRQLALVVGGLATR
ncbi:helix-turn-helix domain-containing protein [Actinoplanes sp. NPDC051851]|uniref:TetR/AcrR family transcriptional regulator n=1 Tax=Actinoplanes sp. NPDC051851 TaxID=3154753 RepID=UPI0034460DCD